jgi:hypothetical protein
MKGYNDFCAARPPKDSHRHAEACGHLSRRLIRIVQLMRLRPMEGGIGKFLVRKSIISESTRQGTTAQIFWFHLKVLGRGCLRVIRTLAYSKYLQTLLPRNLNVLDIRA